MTRGIHLLVIASLALVLGCPSVENAGVEHNNVCIDLSPDGKTLVFSSADGDLYLFDMSRSTATRLTDTDHTESYPSFSPDGTQITFSTTDEDSTLSKIFVLNLSDHSINTVTEDNKQSDILPRFTLDGKRIVFARAYRHRPYSLGGWTWDMWDVCSIGIDGRGLTRLTEESYYQVYRIVPLTDGTFLYAADTMGLKNPAALFTVSPNNKPIQIIPEPGASNAEVNGWASDPMVGPDGETIIFCSDLIKPFWYDIGVKKDDAESEFLGGVEVSIQPVSRFFP